jgi:hypothetical protein
MVVGDWHRGPKRPYTLGVFSGFGHLHPFTFMGFRSKLRPKWH